VKSLAGHHLAFGDGGGGDDGMAVNCFGRGTAAPSREMLRPVLQPIARTLVEAAPNVHGEGDEEEGCGVGQAP